LSDSYLFEEQYPEFIEGRDFSNYDENDKEILSRRIAFIENNRKIRNK
jgi:hypothetical protein